MSVQHDWKKRLADDLRRPENDLPPPSAREMALLWGLAAVLVVGIGLLGLAGG